MFDYHVLISAAPPLAPRDGRTEDLVAGAIAGVLRRQVDVPTQAAVRYPHDEELLASLQNELAQLPAEVAVLACDGLLKPQLVVPFAEPTRGEGAMRRSIVIVNVGIDPDGNPVAVLVDIEAATEASGKFAPTTSFTASVSTVAGDAVSDALEGLFLRATSPFRAHALSQADRAVWLGGDAHDGTLPDMGVEKIEAVLAVRGYTAEVVQRPLRTFATVKERLHNAPPDVLLVWTPHGTPADYEGIANRRFPVLSLDEVDFDEALMLARLLLDELGQRDTEKAGPPASWEEFEERLPELECPAFVITTNARRTLRETGYPNPARMWEHLEKLAEAADAYTKGNGEVGGRLGLWIHEQYGIEVAMHDANLTDEQKRVDLDGAVYSCEPHVKVDDAKAWIEVGRIYFAHDPEGRRFIVDHIGGKLY